MTSEESIVQELAEREWTITTTESCTGGLLAGQLLDVAGASSVYEEGYITYSNEAKERILGVSHDTLEQFGAVSEQTAKEMAAGAAKTANAEVALSTTGVAGPGGGTKEKPVGLVYIGCYINGTVIVKECRFAGDRKQNRMQAVNEALSMLLSELRQ